MSCNRRQAYTLIEMVVAIALGAALMMMTVVMFARFLSARRAGQEHLERELTLGKLSEQFRSDAWGAEQVAKTTPQDFTFRTTTDAPLRVEYHLEEQAVRRTEFLGNDVRSREEFLFADATPLDFAIEQTGREPRVLLRFAPLKSHPTGAEDRYGKPLRIVATLGRDHRFVADQEHAP